MIDVMSILKSLQDIYDEMQEKQDKAWAEYKQSDTVSQEWELLNQDHFLDGYSTAIQDLMQAIDKQCKRFYFTFGTDPEYPYGQDDYVLVYADNLAEAVEKFKAKHPNRPGSDCVNCAFWYNEEQWNKSTKQYYGDRKPVEVIW